MTKTKAAQSATRTYIANARISVDDVLYAEGAQLELTDVQALSVQEYVTPVEPLAAPVTKAD